MTVTVDRTVEEFTAAPRKLFINGQWTDAASGKTFATPNPATGETLANVAEGDAEDINRAVRAAREAFENGPWSRMTPSDRGRLIWKIGDLLLEHADELAQLESLDNGKPVAVARGADVPLAADLFHYMAGWATKIEGNTINISVPYMPGANFHSYTLREPLGVVGQIIPWNFPLLMAAWKLGPALTTGNCVVLKPAEQTPLTALRLAEILAEAGLPDGVVNVVTGFGETAGAALAAHDDVDKVAFTGSTEVGKLIVAASGASNLKKLTLELGGKSPNIVFDDADAGAVEGAANAIFFNHGQCCVAGSRLFVQEDRFDEVVNGVAEIAKGIKLGPGMDSGTQMGPLVSEEQLQRVTGFLDSGREDGATTITGGGRFGDHGYFVEPTVITNTRPEMKIVREEIFGPVVVAAPFRSLDEIAAEANNSE
jgi:phenylacetaldehyde dehydrogenase